MRKTLSGIVAVLTFMLIVAVFGVERAGAAFSVGGAMVDMEASPGTYKHVMQVSLGPDDAATDVQVILGGLGQQSDGVVKVLSPAEDTSPYSACGFISLDQSRFHVGPDQSVQFNAFINIPESVGAGGRYAAIRVCTVPSGGGTLQVASGVDIPVKLTIKGTSLTHTGEINGLGAGPVTVGKPVEISTTFRNTGNHHFKIKGFVTVSNADGQTIGSASIPLTAANVIPTMSRLLRSTVTPVSVLTAGEYTIHAKIMAEDGAVLDEAETKFTVNPEEDFTDIAGHWAENDIKTMARLGIVRGMGDKRFNPSGAVTRAQFAGFLIRSLNIQETRPSEGYFEDVPSDAWYYGAVETAYANGLAFGYGDGTFKPDANITREELAAMVVRGLNKGGKTVAPADHKVLSQFVDKWKIKQWARDSAAIAVREGLIKGQEGKRFAPSKNATRAEAVVMLKRMLVSLGRLSG
ncbi:MAG: S-layer homology domain-containing protein [Bacillota bacterium]